jgi:hypothetical protein
VDRIRFHPPPSLPQGRYMIQVHPESDSIHTLYFGVSVRSDI